MSGLKAIRRRISTVKNTKQITKAMKLVSAAKLRRAQDALEVSRSFIRELEASLAVVLRELGTEFEHTLLTKRAVANRSIVIIGGERGLCGGYNANIIKALPAGDLLKGNAKKTLLPIGKRAEIGVKRLSVSIAPVAAGFYNDPSQWPVSDLANELAEAFTSGALDELAAVYTKFITPITQEVRTETLLPLTVNLTAVAAATNPYTISPDPVTVFEGLIRVYISEKLRMFGLEARASEHAARMTAMDSATKNADELIDKLRLFYNRARQSAITRELIDIVGGAEAVN
jgi:F-type H+-transporting ATPase subunit gamma